MIYKNIHILIVEKQTSIEVLLEQPVEYSEIVFMHR